METFKQLVRSVISENRRLSPEKIIEVFYGIGEEGDLILLKNDGLRQIENFSVVITSSNGSFESIRLDGSDLTELLKGTLAKYAAYKKFF